MNIQVQIGNSVALLWEHQYIWSTFVENIHGQILRILSKEIKISKPYFDNVDIDESYRWYLYFENNLNLMNKRIFYIS